MRQEKYGQWMSDPTGTTTETGTCEMREEVTMIEIGEGNLLSSQVDALVNTVNTVGVMGKGVALQFKRAFPDNFKAYERACKKGEVTTGKMFVWDSGRMGP